MATWPEVEIIPANPTSEIFLNIEDISPMHIFYSPMHKAIVKRGRKKRKFDESHALIPRKSSLSTSLEVL